jgi:hypothetical protein
VDGVHRHLIIIGACSFKRDLVELDVVRFKDLILIERERIFDCHILDVIGRHFSCWAFHLILSERAVRVVEEVVSTSSRSTYCLVVLLSLTNKFSKNRNVFQLFDVDLKDVFDLLEGTLLLTSGLANGSTSKLAFIS